METSRKLEHNIDKVVFHLEGATSLICHKWSEKTKREMLAKQMKEKTSAKEAKNPQQCNEDSLYNLNGKGSGYGFPAVGFKAAAVRAAKGLGFTMTDVMCAMHVNATHGDLVKIEGTPSMREDMVRLNGKVGDIRYRGEFKKWKTKITVDYDPTILGQEEMLAIFARAGKFVGVGEWRPQKAGVNGTWNIKKMEVAK